MFSAEVSLLAADAFDDASAVDDPVDSAVASVVASAVAVEDVLEDVSVVEVEAVPGTLQAASEPARVSAATEDTNLRQ
ncbi:hypothetical protein [Arthrobacter burdickii]|uniref:Uncharacterized protein n=1 Tax=Arthrobacter burdickii TaxID=3035920 RepID=A0ABT8JZ39_9MICC|nr:hypothetical protein [Arthrobacter burdickii]MDN4610434.1 hypothetical protein [Arthrobacter burdickii]